MNPLHSPLAHGVGEPAALKQDGRVVEQGLGLKAVVPQTGDKLLKARDEPPGQPSPLPYLTGSQPGLHGPDLLRDVAPVQPKIGGPTVRHTVHVEPLRGRVVDGEKKDFQLVVEGLRQFQVEDGGRERPTGGRRAMVTETGPRLADALPQGPSLGVGQREGNPELEQCLRRDEQFVDGLFLRTGEMVDLPDGDQLLSVPPRRVALSSSETSFPLPPDFPLQVSPGDGFSFIVLALAPSQGDFHFGPTVLQVHPQRDDGVPPFPASGR
jgi:hypothetical protein